jgi:ribonuclease HII
MRLLGLDEAGRGCVLGPLVVGAFCTESGQTRLRKAGADDSKLLSRERREEVRGRLLPMGEHAVLQMSPQAIDTTNINRLEEEAFVALIVQFRPDRVYIDAPVHPRGIPNFVARLRNSLWPELQIVAECKADSTHAVVGAASIFAKVARDAEIAALGEVGSGYPHDPITRAWLRGFVDRNEPFPPCVRTRWGTIGFLRQMTLFASRPAVTFEGPAD